MTAKSYPPLLPIKERTPSVYEHLSEYSSIKGLRLCHPLNRCRKKICPHCSKVIASRARADLRAYARNQQFALVVRLSTPSGHSIHSAWKSLSTARSAFTRGSWLTTRCRSWYRSTEVTHSAEGWNWHDNWLIFGNSKEDLASLAESIHGRWEYPHQYAELARNIPAAASYITKSLLTPARHGNPTPGDILHDYAGGDADAADLWEEIENFFSSGRRILTSKGGNLRAAKRPAVAHTPKGGRPDLDLYGEYLDLMPMTVRPMARALGCSPGLVSKYNHQRAHLNEYIRTNRYGNRVRLP